MSEVEALVLKAKHGDRCAILDLIDHYKPFIEKAIRKVSLSSFDKDDLMQIGYVSLINSLNKYKEGSNSFCGYAYRAIVNSINYTVRSNVKHNNVSLNKPLGNSNNIGLVDLLEDQINLEDTLLAQETNKNIRHALKSLSKKELELIILLYYSKVSLKKYATQKNISYQTAVRRKKAVLKKLREKLIM